METEGGSSCQGSERAQASKASSSARLGGKQGAFDDEGHLVLEQQIDAALELGVSAGSAGGGVIGFRREAVDGDLDLFERGDAGEQLGQLGRDQPGVGEERDLEPQPPGKEVQLGEILAQERLAAGEAHRERAEIGGLCEDALPAGGIQLALARLDIAGRAVDVAVQAGVVAALGQLDIEVGEERASARPERLPTEHAFFDIGLIYHYGQMIL